ncbi:MAG: dehydratase [Propionibacteriales bacterium]|nr:dehydratase [Propionibacteriales bacterium]
MTGASGQDQAEVRVFSGLDDLTQAQGEVLGSSRWHTVTQDQVNLFADATGDHQWIHVDIARATAGPFGSPIAHGFLTLSLLPTVAAEIYRVEDVTMGINYGLNRVRFPSPVLVGSRVRAVGELTEVSDVPQGKQLVVRYTVEIEGHDKPACVADMVSRLLR